VTRCLVISVVVSAVAAYGQDNIQASPNPPNPKELVSQSIRNYQRDWQTTRMSWASTETDVTESDGTKEVEVSEVIPLAGTPYDRLIRKHGRPLTAAEQRKEDRKYERALRQREEETPGEREARIRKYDEQRAFVSDIPNAYDFSLLGEETIDGRPSWIIGMTPRAGFTPTTPHGSMLGHIEGKLWIDEKDVQWAKAEAHVIETIGIGWIVARIERGTRFTLEQTRIENGLWMPQRITIAGAARVMIFHSKTISEELTWSGYRRADSVSADKHTDAYRSPAGVSKSFH
jgi:hypothetical protein